MPSPIKERIIDQGISVSLSSIFQDANYKLTQFSQEIIEKLESSIIVSEDKKGKTVYKIECLVRKKREQSYKRRSRQTALFKVFDR